MHAYIKVFKWHDITLTYWSWIDHWPHSPLHPALCPPGSRKTEVPPLDNTDTDPRQVTHHQTTSPPSTDTLARVAAVVVLVITCFNTIVDVCADFASGKYISTLIYHMFHKLLNPLFTHKTKTKFEWYLSSLIIVLNEMCAFVCLLQGSHVFYLGTNLFW